VIETEQQRRWWFATHPEFSAGATRQKGNPRDDEDEEDTGRPSPEAVDAWVDERLEYERDNAIITMLKLAKYYFGTELARKTPAERYAIVWGDEEPGKSEAEPEEGSFGSAYGWAKDNSEEALDLALSYVLGPLAGPKRIERAIRSLEKRLAEHEQKLADYINNPDAHDNRELLKNARTPEMRQKIIQGRVKGLQRQIDLLKRDISRLKGGLK
jgi:hypothetical protein